MKFIKSVTNSDALKHIIELPESLRNQEVPSARGALKQYANKDLFQYEQDAWEKAVRDKHEHR